MKVLTLPIVDIDVQPGFNARVSYGVDDGSLDALAASIKDRGVRQPIIVRPGEGGRWLLVAGHRRLRAAQMAERSEIPAVVDSDANAELLDAALENLARRDLCVIERARLYRKLEEQGWTQGRIAGLTGGSRERVPMALRLLKLPADVQQLNMDRKLGESHLLELMPLRDAGYRDETIVELARRAVEKRSTAGIIRIAVNNLLESGATLGKAITESASVRLPPPPPPAARRGGKMPRTTPLPPRVAGSILARQVRDLELALERCVTASMYADPAEGCTEVRRIAESALAASRRGKS